MAENNKHIIGLLEKYSSGQASLVEEEELFTLLRAGGFDETVVSFIATRLEAFEPGDPAEIVFWKNRLAGGASQITGSTVDKTESTIVDQLPAGRRVHRIHFLRKWHWAAASVILLVSTGVYFWTYSSKDNSTFPVTIAANTHIAPGKNGAVLTLADGSQVDLDNLGNGLVANQNGTQVVLKGGGLTYDPTGAGLNEVTYNTMTTPRGRQFQVKLPDGTSVWLNAGSSLRFPTVFTGTERRVSVTGEAYFEVAHNARVPFKVSVNNKEELEVLGTFFNVNAYPNEAAIHTTLLQGSVRVSSIAGKERKNQPFVVLKPGQQSQIPHHDLAAGSVSQPTIKVINHADINKVMAWKNGLFNFEGATLAEVMRQIERWYDIDIAYEKGIPDIAFEGKMTKDVPLKDLLVMLERSDIHFKIEDRKLTVLP
ncbi:MAG: FecR domain-containing protein [Chitinophagaceae bacterium]